MLAPPAQTTRGVTAAIILLACAWGALWWTKRSQPPPAGEASSRPAGKAVLGPAERTELLAAPELGPVATPPEELAEVSRAPVALVSPTKDADSAGATIAGRLEDIAGAPISNRAMWRMEAEGPQPRILESHESPLESAVTDADGRFEFPSVPKGRWWIGPAPLSDDVPPLARSIKVVRAGRRIEFVLRVDRGLFVRGCVLDPSGAPAPSCAVWGSARENRLHVNVRTDGDGVFVLGPLPSGTWTLVADAWNDKYAMCEEVAVAAGSEGVVLRLRVGGSLSGEVVDATTGRRSACTLCLVPRDAMDLSGWIMTSSDLGAIDFGGVLPGPYVVVAQGHDGKVGISSALDVLPGERTDGVRIALAEGARLELVNERGRRPVWCTIHVDGALFNATFVGTIGTGPMIVPAGAIEVRWCERGNPERERTERVTLRAGEERTITLRVRP